MKYDKKSLKERMAEYEFKKMLKNRLPDMVCGFVCGLGIVYLLTLLYR